MLRTGFRNILIDPRYGRASWYRFVITLSVSLASRSPRAAQKTLVKSEKKVNVEYQAILMLAKSKVMS